MSSLAVYRDTIADLDRMIGALASRREELQRRLDLGAERTSPQHEQREHHEHDERKLACEHEQEHEQMPQEPAIPDYTVLPEGLPAPADDGAADHLPGARLPDLELPTSDGGLARLAALGPGRTVLYLYPLTGRPGVDLPDGWDAIPGARGCSTETCDFRDHFQDLRAAGAERVYGLSSQDPAYQAEVVERLRLPFGMISDESFALGRALRLPTFSAPGHDRLYARLTLIVRDAAIEHVFYPIFPPDQHARQVLAWLEQHPLDGPSDRHDGEPQTGDPQTGDPQTGDRP